MSIVLRLLIAWTLLSLTLSGPFILAPLIRIALRRLGWLAAPAARQIEDHGQGGSREGLASKDTSVIPS
jgi:hypothetical protein